MRVLLDTNILLRSADPLSPLHSAALLAVSTLAARGHTLHLSAQGVFEFWTVATRPARVNGLGLEPRNARAAVDDFLLAYRLIPDPSGLFDLWLELVSRHDVSGKATHDARMAAFAIGHGIPYLLTLDGGDFARYAEIRVVDPRDPATFP